MWGRRRRTERDFAQEVDSHLRLEADKLIEEGMSHDDARATAVRRFGNVTAHRERFYESGRVRWLDHLWRDLGYGARMLRKRPGFTAVAVLSLAIGIGANTIIFSLVNAIMLRAFPADRPEELVNVYSATRRSPYGNLSYPDFENLRDGTVDVFSAVGVAVGTRVPIDREVVTVEAVTGDYFSLLGVEAGLGRVIGPTDDLARGAHPVAMLSHVYWQRRFGGDPDIVGRELSLAGRPYTIVGVAPVEHRGTYFVLGTHPALYVPMSMYDELMGYKMSEAGGLHNLFGRARLAPGVTLAQAETAVAAVAASLDAARPDNWGVGDGFTLVPTMEVLAHPAQVDPYLRRVAALLMGVVGLVLLLACTNLASFLLARARDRRREVAVRLALGASRGALVRQLLTETSLLTLLGSVAGLGLAVWLLLVLVNTNLPLPFNLSLNSLDLGLDWTVLAFTGGVSVLAGTVLGLVPAWQTTRPDVVSTLKQDTAGGGQPGQLRWRNALVVTQLTVSLVLLVGAGLFLRSYQQRLAIDTGFGRDPAAIVLVRIPSTQLAVDQGRQYTRRLLDRFRVLPGVEVVGITSNPPLVGIYSMTFMVDGHEPPQGQDAHRASQANIDPTFFEAAGIPMVQGRRFRDADGPEAPQVAIVSEALARSFWPDGEAVGRLLRRPNPDDPDLRIVGVVGDVPMRSLGEPPALTVYMPYTQAGNYHFYFFARTSVDPEQTALTMVTAGQEIDPELWVSSTTTMARHSAVPRRPAQLGAVVLAVFAVVALALAVIGLYGVVSYVVASRTREVGIRMALGADAPAITRLLAGDGMRLVLIGTGIGLTLALLVSGLLSDLLVGTRTTDPIAFVGAPLVLLATAVLAAYLPARRASRANPVTALRAE